MFNPPPNPETVPVSEGVITALPMSPIPPSPPPVPEHLIIEVSEPEIPTFTVEVSSRSEITKSIETAPSMELPLLRAQSKSSKSPEPVSEDSEQTVKGSSKASELEQEQERAASPLPPSDPDLSAPFIDQTSDTAVQSTSQGEVEATAEESEGILSGAEEMQAEEGRISSKRKKRKEMKAMRGESMTMTTGKEAACCVCLVASVVSMLMVVVIVSTLIIFLGVQRVDWDQLDDFDMDS